MIIRQFSNVVGNVKWAVTRLYGFILIRKNVLSTLNNYPQSLAIYWEKTINVTSATSKQTGTMY